MNLTKLVLKRPVSTVLVIIGIVVFGAFSIMSFDMELMPDIELPMMVVYTVYPGADPDSVDQLVNSKIEDSGEALSGVSSVMSYAYENYGMVALTYDYDQDMNDAYTDLSAAMDLLDLPDDAGDPTIIEMDVNAMDSVTISAVNDGSPDMMSYIEDTVVPQLESVTNVARVTVTGGRENYVRVKLNQDKMNQYGLNIQSVAASIGAAEYNVPAGTISGGSQDISVASSAEFLTLDDLKNTVLTTGKGSLITLGDIAEVSVAAKDASAISRYNGEDTVSIGVTKVQSASTVSVARSVKSKIKQLQAADTGVKFEISYDAGSQIIKSLKNVAETLILGVILAMAVLFLFFGDWKASLIVGSSMPISVFATLVCMFLFGFDLNIITTGALVIAIGMIVDNSIVVIESCFRMKDEEDKREDLAVMTKPQRYREAAIRGAGTVMMSILASTITTIVVYLPMSFINGMAGQMFSQLGLIIVFAMIASLISALTVVPLLYVFVKPQEKKESRINHFLDRTNAIYEKILRILMKHKKTTMAVSVLLLILSGVMASTMDFELIPTTYDGSIIITSTYRSGTKLEKISEALEDQEKMIAEDKNFENYSLSIQENQAVLTAYAKDNCKRSSEEAVEVYTEAFSGSTDCDVFVEATGSSSMSMGSGMSSSSSYATNLISVVLEADDLDALQEGCDQVQAMMEEVPGVIHISSDAASRETTAHIVVDPLKAANAGLTPAAVAADLYQTLTGVTAASMEMDGEDYDIILNYPDGMYEDVNQLMSKKLTGTSTAAASAYSAAASGGVRQVVLSDIAHIEYKEQPQHIQKTNGRYQQTISATASESARKSAKKTITNKAANLEYPEGVKVSSSYVDNMRGENLSAIGYAILAGIFLVFLVMAMQFESPRFSLMVMTCIPFSLIGSFLLLFIAGTSFNMVSMMGFLMLMGIVVNDGILLVDTANQNRVNMPIEDALVKAGQTRLRPILMTTLTTILAMVPLAVAKDSEMMQGMAFVIIGGLTASTLLCLLMMPTYYLLIDKDTRREKRELKKYGLLHRKKEKEGIPSEEQTDNSEPDEEE